MDWKPHRVLRLTLLSLAFAAPLSPATVCGQPPEADQEVEQRSIDVDKLLASSPFKTLLALPSTYRELRRQALVCHKLGLPPSEIMVKTGMKARRIKKIVRRYEKQRAKDLRDRQQQRSTANSGTPRRPPS